MIFRANRMCNQRTPSDPSKPTTCYYRTDVTVPTYYRGFPSRTETFREGVVYDINLPRQGDPSSWTTSTPLADSACLFKFANQYASQSPGNTHDASMGITIDFGPIGGFLCNPFGIEVCRFIINAILNWIIGFIIQGILCNLITGMFWIVDSQGQVTSARGAINLGVENIYKFLRDYVETPLSSEVTASLYEDKTAPEIFIAGGYSWPGAPCNVPGSSYCPYPPAIDFTNNDIFKAVSLLLNDILGNVSTTPGYYEQGKLTIVEAIDILTGNTQGILKLGYCPDGLPPPTCSPNVDCAGVCDGDITKELKLSDYPRFTWTGQPIFNGKIELVGMLIRDLNKITRLKILDNGYIDAQTTNPFYTHTLKNSLSMTSLTVEAKLNILLTDGSWVHRPEFTVVPPNEIRAIPMTTVMAISFQNIILDIDLFMLLRPDKMSDKKIGSVFGNFPDGSLTDRLRCAAYGLDLAQFSKLQVGGTLSNLQLSNFLGDLGGLATRATTIYQLGYKAATNLYLKFITDNWVRPQINDYLLTNTYDGKCAPIVNGECSRPDSLDYCPPTYPYYFSNTDPNRYVNFYDSRVWNLIKNVVNDLVGGIPVRTGAASINTIIDTFLMWYVPLVNKFGVTLNKLPNNPTNNVLTREMGNLDAVGSGAYLRFEGGDTAGGLDKFIELNTFGLRNLETVHELSIKPTSASNPRKFRLDIKVGGGKIYDRIPKVYISNGLLTVKFHLITEVTEKTDGVDVNYAQDEADISLQFGNLTIGTDIYALLNQNEFLDLEYGQLMSPACLLALVDDFNMETLSIGFQQFALKIDRQRLPNWRSRDKNCPSNLWCPGGSTLAPTSTPLIGYTHTCTLASSNFGKPCTGGSGSATTRVRFSDALDELALEARTWGPTVNNMIQYFFNGLAKLTQAGINKFADRDIPIAGCEKQSILSDTPFAFFTNFLQNVTDATKGPLAFLEKLAVDQYNPRFPRVDKNDPSHTMIGSQPGDIDYSQGPVYYRNFTGFPAAQCQLTPLLKGPYVALDKNDTCWEDRVKVLKSDKSPIDLRNTFIVSEVQKFVSKSGRKVLIDAIHALSTTQGNFIGDSIITYPVGASMPYSRTCNVVGANYCIDLSINLTRAGVPSFHNDLFIPGLAIDLRWLYVLNFETFDADPKFFELLKPYVPDQYNPVYDDQDNDARFTLAHRVRFTGSTFLQFLAEVDVSVAEKFVVLNSPNPDRNVTDTLKINFQLKEFEIQVMTMTAINSTRVAEVPFYYYVNPFSPEKCFFSIFYQNGLYVPQFQIYTTDIKGPFATIEPRFPAGTKPNIFSQGMGDLVVASLEIFFQLMKEDLPDATQGNTRKYINRVLNDYVTFSRDANNCPDPKPCSTNPNDPCHWVNFLEENIQPILSTINNAVGGNPITTSQVDINALIELGLNYTFFSPVGPRLAAKQDVQHPVVGDYFLPSPLDYTNGPSSIKMSNLGIRGLNTIYKLIIGTVPTLPHSLTFAFEMGNGDMYNGANSPATLFRADPLVIHADFDLIVKAKRPGDVLETLANNQFRVELKFSNLNLTSMQEILINKTDFFLLNINQISKTQCALSVIDKVTLQTVALQIADFDVEIPLNDCPTSCPAPKFGRDPPCSGVINTPKCNIGIAINTLRDEALGTNVPVPPAASVPVKMLNAILKNVAGSLVNGFNKIDIWNKPREHCDVPRVVLKILSGVTNSTHAAQLITRLTTNVTGILKVPAPQINSDFKRIIVQSERAATLEGRDAFIADVIESARDARGLKPTPEVILGEGSFCNELNLPTYLDPVCSSLVDGTSNLTDKLTEWTREQPNLIEERRSPLNIESNVRLDVTKDPHYDIRQSKIVSSVSGYFEKNSKNFNALLKDIANKTTTSFLFEEDDGSVTLRFNMTDAIFWIDENLLSGKSCNGSDKTPEFLLQEILGTSNLFIPGLRILPGMFEVRNFGYFSDLIVLKPYTDGHLGARFTTQHEFGWRMPNKPLNVTLSVDLFFDKAFKTGDPIPSGVEDLETITITLTAYDLLIQALTLLAVNTKELGQVSLGDFLVVDAAQAFKRNCKAATCLMRGIYDGGLFMPQLTVNVTNIIGPRFVTRRNLFTAGMEQLIDALFELVVQLFRDDLSNLTQGPLLDFINNMLVTTLGNAKAEGACPPRRNYTLTYPNGQYYCSHNDTTGDSSLLTQTEHICNTKGNGHLCFWEPPDGEITEQTVACFYTKESKILNFATARGLVQLKDFVDNRLMDPKSSLYINSYLKAFVGAPSTQLLSIDNFPLKYNGNSYGSVSLGIGNLVIEGLSTVDHLEIFDIYPFKPSGDGGFTNPPEYEAVPPSRRLLLNTFSDEEASMALTARRDLAAKLEFGYADNKYMSRTAIGWTGPLSIYFEILYKFDELFVPRDDGPKDFVMNHVSIKFILHDFDIAVDLYMLVNIPRLMDLQIRSIGTLAELPCILEIFEDNGLIPTRANITYGQVGFELDCVDRCDSPFFAPLKGVKFTDQASQSLRDKFTDSFRKITNFLVKLLASSGAQDFLNRQIQISNTQCTAIKTGIFGTLNKEDIPETDAASAMGIAGLASLFAAFVGFALLVPVHFRRRDELMKRALLDAHSRGTAGKSKDEFELAERRLKSAFEHPMMHPAVRFGVPFWIIVNVIFFATANFAAAGAIVELTIKLADETTYPITILPFTLPTSINDMWNAGTYLLALLIALLSGAWPYTKQVLMLFAWFAPSTVLHPKARGRMLEILDQLGKWSLIDVYVLVMLMVGFRFYLSSSAVETLSLLPKDVLVIDVVVTPGWGIFGFVLGAIGSLLVNHIMIWHHRKVIRMDEDLQDAILGTLVKDLRTPRIPLSRHRFNILDAEGRPYRYSVGVRVLIVFVLIISFFLLIIGAVVPILHFEFRGIGGLAISIINPDLAAVTNSIVSIGTSLIAGARSSPASILGILFIQILYILFALIIPLLLCVLLIGIWVVPLTLREQLLLYFVAEVLSAWEAVLVLVVALIAALLQISELTQFIVNAATDSLCKSLEKQLEKFFPDPSDAKCFDVVASFLPSSAVFIIAAAIFFIGYQVMFRLIHAAIEDRELAMRRKPPHSPGEMSGLTGFIVRRALEAFGASQIANGGSVANLFAQEKGAFDPRDSQMTPANPILAREMPQSMQGMQTQNPMFHGSLGGMSRGTHQSIDV